MIGSKKERILLKISGGNLKKNDLSSFFNEELLENLVFQIKKLSETYSVALVVGGGNIWRGDTNRLSALKEKNSHYIGMMSTLINSFVIQNFLSKSNVKSVIYSALICPQISENINSQNIENSFNNGEVVIFAGGTGIPYVSTDTCAIVRAIEIGATIVLFGKDGIKGIYDKDPKKYQDAVFFKKLSYDEIISKRLQVIDQTALFLAQKHKLRLLIFNQTEKDGFLKTLNEKLEHTKVS